MTGDIPPHDRSIDPVIAFAGPCITLITMATREDLEGYIAQTKRNQQRLGIGLAIALIAAIACTILNVAFAPHAIGLVVIVGVCGFWVTGAHIQDFRRRIADLREGKEPLVSHHRRYER